MLKITTYTKKDLVELFNTDRLDSIERSLKRLGYEYTKRGRGDKLELTITKTPNAFKMFCINELGVSPQTDFTLLRNFFYYFFCDEEFQQLPIGQMVEAMEQDGKTICRQTISKWIQFLEKQGIISIDNANCLYYVSFTIGEKHFVEEISREDYSKAWRKYWKIRKNGGTYAEAFNAMCQVNGGTIFKKPAIEENAFYNELICDLIDVLLDDLK